MNVTQIIGVKFDDLFLQRSQKKNMGNWFRNL